MSRLPGIQKRLAKVEQKLIAMAKGEGFANCICTELTVALPERPEEFEAEMNKKCPVHGIRQLGKIAILDFEGAERARLDQLLEIYRARQFFRELPISQLRRIGLELKHGSEA